MAWIKQLVKPVCVICGRIATCLVVNRYNAENGPYCMVCGRLECEKLQDSEAVIDAMMTERAQRERTV